ncbi:group III truncated hemoglobin [Sphingobium limneticum]|jgi:hemoglobin
MIGARVVDGVSKIREEELTPLVEEFYARVRADPALGPIFNDAIDDWPEHLGKLTAFWSSVMLTSGRYKGQPVPAHLKHKARITPALFERWLALWVQTTNDRMTPEAAAALQAKARRIAESLQLAMFFQLEERSAASVANAERKDAIERPGQTHG